MKEVLKSADLADKRFISMLSLKDQMLNSPQGDVDKDAHLDNPNHPNYPNHPDRSFQKAKRFISMLSLKDKMLNSP